MKYLLTAFFVVVVFGDLYLILRRRKFIEKYRRRALLSAVAIMTITLYQLMELWLK